MLDVHLFGPLTVPLRDVSAVTVRPPGVAIDLAHGASELRDVLHTIKCDLAELNQHVVIEKKNVYWRRILITPEDPAGFALALEEARVAADMH